MSPVAAPTIIRQPDRVRRIAARVADDFPAFAYDGFGIMLSDDQAEAYAKAGPFGPRHGARDPKETFISGGQRGGKTVMLALGHADADLYKRGVDNTDRVFWRNYLYKTLAIAPTTELTLKLWTVMDEISKGASDAQWDRRARRARGGAFLGLMKAGKLDKWPVVTFVWGSRVDFRSSEGYAFRLEGDQWWAISWDEWASQPDREIDFVRREVLLGRSRDHDAKIWLAAWPKAATERHLVRVMREIESGKLKDTRVVFIRSDRAHFTNQTALAVERKVKDEAMWKRTVLGEPGGGASLEFKQDVVANMVDPDLKWPELPGPDDHAKYRYFVSWDLGISHDETVGITWRIPRIGVFPQSKARIVNAQAIRGSEGLTLDHICYAIQREQMLYQADSAVDATGLGGIATVRQLRDLKPTPLAFVSRSNDRIHGNMRLAAITNAIEMLTWERQVDEEGEDIAPLWGVVESPPIIDLIDQLANFDREAKDIADDWAWSFMIGLWYIRKYWLVDETIHRARRFDGRIIRSGRTFATVR